MSEPLGPQRPGRQSLLDNALARALGLTGAALGNIQLMDWKTGALTIRAQHGFGDEFLRLFRFVRIRDGSACARAIRHRCAIVVEDVLLDREFAPYRNVALQAGFRAVQSTPLISTSGAFLGVLSTHFAARHQPSDATMRALKAIGEAAANAIIAERAGSQVHPARAVNDRVARSLAAVEHSYRLLQHLERKA